MTKLEPCVNFILQTNNWSNFDKAHSNNYLFSKLEGRIFGGITVCIGCRFVAILCVNLILCCVLRPVYTSKYYMFAD